jgi:hypothetical protein
LVGFRDEDEDEDEDEDDARGDGGTVRRERRLRRARAHRTREPRGEELGLFRQVPDLRDVARQRFPRELPLQHLDAVRVVLDLKYDLVPGLLQAEVEAADAAEQGHGLNWERIVSARRKGGDVRGGEARAASL